MDISISYSGAALAGILSFFSPCVLPLVPFYLCYLAGISMEEFKKEGSFNFKLRKKLIINTVFFSAGGSSYKGAFASKKDGKLIFNALEFLEESQFQQNGATLLVNGTVATNGGVTYLSGETLAAEISTGIDGVNRIASDTECFSD